MLLSVLAGLALAANPYEGRDADVVATAMVAASPERVSEALDDARELLALYPKDCLLYANLPDGDLGEGSRFKVKYQAGPMHRGLWATVTHVESGRYIEWDHEGNRGFVTRFTLSAEGQGTRVEVKTWLAPPPWPFRGTYFNKVQPAWTACYEGLLEGLAKGVEG